MARQSRTWLCSVVFLDIVAFSKRPVSGQLAIKQHLTRLIGDALTEVPKNDTILLDSGDGAAVCFLADPVEALFFALGLHAALASKPPKAPEYQCRIGVNLGPVKVIKDVTGRRNTVGDGINSAQRVMDFAEPGQLLVSRSFHDVVACLSEEYQQLFSYLGIRRDKHVKEYDIYEVKVPNTPLSELMDDDYVDDYANPDITPDAQATAAKPEWDKAELDRLSRELADLIGPLAKVLVKRAAARACGPDELYQMLAEHLPDEDLRAAFLHDHAAAGQTPSPAASTTTIVADTQPLQLPDDIREQLRHRLAEDQGPVAKILIKRALKQASGYPELCRILAGDLPPEQREAFLAFGARLWDGNGSD